MRVLLLISQIGLDHLCLLVPLFLVVVVELHLRSLAHFHQDLSEETAEEDGDQTHRDQGEVAGREDAVSGVQGWDFELLFFRGGQLGEELVVEFFLFGCL
jgi:hypothetical protein